MGGNALKAINPVRLKSEGVQHLFNKVEWVANMLGDNARLVPWTSDKTDHGDVDIIVSPRVGNKVDVDQYLAHLGVPAGPSCINMNGPVTSVAVPVHASLVSDAEHPGPLYAQVDLISCDEEDVPFTKLYFSGGGLGMLIGRVASSCGFVFASDGLRIRALASIPWSRDVTLTKDPRIGLTLLGYDPMRGGGFTTEVDVWRYALSSPIARPWMFLSKNTNAENRSRDKQRPSFSRFQAWLHDTYSDADLGGPVEWPTDEEMHRRCVEYAEAHLGIRVSDEIAIAKHEYERDRAYHRAWGRDAVRMVVPENESDDRVGEIIGAMQRYLPPKEDRRRIFNLDPTLATTVASNAARLALMNGGRNGQ